MLFYIGVQFLTDAETTQAAKRLCLNLAHTLARHPHLSANFIEGMGLSIQETIA